VGGKIYNYVMANAAKGNQAIPRVSSNLHFVTYLYLFVSPYLLRNINDEEIKRLQQHPLIREIKGFLSSLMESSVAIS
jgi:hypothetical protein